MDPVSPLTRLTESDRPFVPFVGAGASALPPSSLPTWTQFNDLLLECLCERLADYSDGRQPTDDMLEVFRERRDKSRFFAPDFQAQLIEEEVGLDYFRVWQSLETDAYGPVHVTLAALAARGRLAAIITTNFDRLLEFALEAKRVPFRVFKDEAAFGELAHSIDAGPLPVIKIHGSIEDAASLVDTLKQRVAGRPASLMRAMRMLMVRDPWLYLGFSGADFSHDPHYLGILDAAVDAEGFVFLVRKQTAPLDGVRRLADAYGPDKAAIVKGDLPAWLIRAFGLDELAELPARPESTQSQAHVKAGIQRWTDELGPMAVVNIVCSMLTSSGLEAQSFWLLRKTFKSYRRPVDTESRSYQRYNYNYGQALLNAGLIENPIELADDKSNFFEWKEHADQNAFEFLGRAYTQAQLIPSGAHLAALMAYRGEVGRGIGLAATVTDEALARGNKTELCDVAIASAPIYDIVRLNPIEQLRHCVALAREVGDELRRATLCALLGRFLTYAGEFAEAAELLDEAERVARSLDLPPVLLAARAARGRWLTDSATSDDEAVRVLREVESTVRALYEEEPLVTKFDLFQPDAEPTVISARHPMLCRILLDLNRAACFAGDADVINETLDALDERVADKFIGYCPHYYLAYAQCLLEHGDGDQRDFVSELIARARKVGQASENPWVEQAADDLEGRRARAGL